MSANLNFCKILSKSESGTLNEVKEIYPSILGCIKYDQTNKLNRILFSACLGGNKDVAEWLINEKHAIVTEEVIYRACYSGNIELLKFIIPRLIDGQKLKFSEIFDHSCNNKNNYDFIKWLWINQMYFNEKIDTERQFTIICYTHNLKLIKWVVSTGIQISKNTIEHIIKVTSKGFPEVSAILVKMLNGNVPKLTENENENENKLLDKEFLQCLINSVN